MKILITTDMYEPEINGVVTSVINLKNGLTQLGHDVKILTLSQSIHTYTEEEVTKLGSLPFKIVYPGARVSVTPHKSVMAELEEWKPDVIHSQCEFTTFIAARKLSKSLNVPLIHTYHTVYEDYTHYFSLNKNIGKSAVHHFSKWISKKCDCIITPTEKVRRLLYGYNVKCPIEVVPTGIETANFAKDISAEKKRELSEKLSIPEGKKIALFVGRLAKEKNLSEILENWKKIDLNRWLLLIAGGGPYKDELIRQCHALGIEDSVLFAGMIPREEIIGYYKLADLFVSASTSETQGLTYIEALAGGVPLLCKKDDCLDGILENGKNGFSFTNQEDFINIMNDISNGKTDMALLKENALSSSEKFDTSAFAKKVAAIYSKFSGCY